MTRDWHRAESEHFAFFVSDEALFNDYCIDNLERFFDTAAGVLTFDDDELERIEREKIYYFLCRDQEEIKLLAGFHARGMFIVAYDFVVTNFSLQIVSVHSRSRLRPFRSSMDLSASASGRMRSMTH